MHLHTTLLLAIAATTGGVSAICSPEWSYGIGTNVEQTRWSVYDLQCNMVETADGNPCDQGDGRFTCSKAPLMQFTGYKNTASGNHYNCTAKPHAGNCGGEVISICCKNSTITGTN
ncbi:hypothetical protein AAF712_005433 [Marasmius tenuissimus]|uniref:Secreted protein n=1 Tax=Marasmius tenuissimus TaxID=585030 RepID=A0ABR3A0A7_9AGAR|nr:hypothetical protein PM082_008863 [Marasmius tenuissimus]